jgi:hypothetical protein
LQRCVSASGKDQIGDRDMIEQWRAVVGFEGSYEVSDQGRVRSLDRAVIYQRIDQYSGRTITVTKYLKGRMLRPGTMKSGHQFVVLGRRHGFCVHVLVLTAFTGPAPEGTECCHNDGEPGNNVHSNLRWDTRANNIIDDFRSGVRRRGSISRGTVPGNSYARRTAA